VGDVRAFGEDQAFGGRISAGYKMASDTAEGGLYRLRKASDTPYNGAYNGRRTFGQKLAGAVAAVARMVLPVLALLAGIAGIYLYRDTPVPLFLNGVGVPWLTAADLIVPVAFFCVFLTNRRYGPAYAFAQVVIVCIAVAALAVFARDIIFAAFPPDTIPAMREAAAFGAAFFTAAFVSTIVFDGTRGAYWWTAPLFGSLSAAIVFPMVFFPVCFLGTATPWLHHALEYGAVLAGEGLALLIPYWFLRRMVPPLSGFGGY
jgi:uncharacterized PurR-regulated membrane protein YhhQ (DUF165 family)